MPDQGKAVPVVMIPRFTTFVGPSPIYFTSPVRVEAYDQALITVYRGPISGSGGSVGFSFLESTDRDPNYWSIIDENVDPGSNAQTQVVATLTKRWFRMGIILGGTTPNGVTCWAQGFLLRRER